MAVSDRTRLSVLIADVHAGREAEFLALARQLDDLLNRNKYARADTIGDEALPSRFYAVRQWTTAEAARRSHSNPEANALSVQLSEIALINHVVNGVRQGNRGRTEPDRRARADRDRRAGFERRAGDVGRPTGNRRIGRERRLGPRRARERTADLIGAARRARENAAAPFSNFKVGAALETSDGTIITGCNVENSTYGLSVCAEQVAMVKALSDGHRAFTRIAIVADSEAPAAPCGACRQILWEFGGNLEIRLANLAGEQGTHRLEDLLPLPFDGHLL